MPKFLDHHATMPDVPPETAREMAGRIKAGEPDEFGVTGLNVFMCANGRVTASRRHRTRTRS